MTDQTPDSARFTYHDNWGGKVAAGSPEHVSTRDHQTNLEWLIRPRFDGLAVGRDNAEAICAALEAGGHRDWTLPRHADLLTLIALKGDQAASSSSLPPTEDGTIYWTSSIQPQRDKAYIAQSLDSMSHYLEFRTEPFGVLPVRWFGDEPRPPESREVWLDTGKTIQDGELDALKDAIKVLVGVLIQEQADVVRSKMYGAMESRGVIYDPEGDVPPYDGAYFQAMRHVLPGEGEGEARQ